MNLNQIKQTLEAGKIQLTKSLGQNFLHDVHQVRRILQAADLGNSDRVLEIGPGLGALTQLLLEKVPEVLAIEKAQRLYDFLSRRWPSQPGLTLLHADAVQYLQQHPRDWSNWKLVSNLPYSVASAILVELSKMPAPPGRVAVTLQFEVAQRLAASARQDDYGVLTLLVQLRYEITGVFKIPATCFFPVPNIDSACVTLLRRNTPLLAPGQFRAFEKIVKRGFSQRRKMMLKLLKADWPLPRLQEALAALSIPATARAETVSLEQYVELTRRLTETPVI
jgi:16S rRNA (adenine1518-N6/adenine1519-N6)-dimethyltransferase